MQEDNGVGDCKRGVPVDARGVEEKVMTRVGRRVSLSIDSQI